MSDQNYIVNGRVDYQRYLASRDWALKREKVKQRSCGICERCQSGDHEQTHHLTYARVGNELLEDLQGVCRRCHEYLSGKSHYDPVQDPLVNIPDGAVSVYLAGKIAKNDWRHSLFDIRSRTDQYEFHHAPPRDKRTGKLIYAGPYFIGCDHGCFHSQGSHGRGAISYEPHYGLELDNGRNRELYEEVVFNCTQWIGSASYVFVWLNSPDAYGTLAEMGYAAALAKPIYLAHPPDLDVTDMWFASNLAAWEYVGAPDARSAWSHFLRTINWHYKTFRRAPQSRPGWHVGDLPPLK